MRGRPRVGNHRGIGLGGEGARRDGVAGDAAPAELRRQRPHHAGQALLGRRIDGVARAREFAHHGRDGDQPAAALAHHALGRELGQQQAGHQVGVDQFADLGGRGVGQRFAVARAHVVDQDVQPAMLGVDAGESLRHGGIVGHVEGQRMRVQPVAPERVGGRLGRGRIAAVDQHARATAGQRPRDAQTQPTGRSGHQRDLAAEFEVAQIRQGIHVIRLWLGTGKETSCLLDRSLVPIGAARIRLRRSAAAPEGRRAAPRVGPLIRGIPGPSAAAAAPATSRNTPARSPPATAA